VKLSSDYRLMIVDRGEDHELARFSGGEQDLANLCLRLAIADWVSKERSVDLGFVVLDEVFGSQDDERRQRLLSELRALSGRFRQMLVITHLSDIADLCDSHVEVSLLEPGRSSAVVA
jgi:exonuclease SbcC